MFDKMKQLYDMQKKAKDLQKQMEALRVEKTSRDGLIKVIVNGTNKIESVSIDPSYLSANRQQDLERAVKDLINDAFAQIHEQTAAQAAQLMKGLNIPGL